MHGNLTEICQRHHDYSLKKSTQSEQPCTAILQEGTQPVDRQLFAIDEIMGPSERKPCWNTGKKKKYRIKKVLNIYTNMNSNHSVF